MESCCEGDNEHFGFIRSWEFLSSYITGDFSTMAQLYDVSSVQTVTLCFLKINFLISTIIFPQSTGLRPHFYHHIFHFPLASKCSKWRSCSMFPVSITKIIIIIIITKLFITRLCMCYTYVFHPNFSFSTVSSILTLFILQGIKIKYSLSRIKHLKKKAD